MKNNKIQQFFFIYNKVYNNVNGKIADKSILEIGFFFNNKKRRDFMVELCWNATPTTDVTLLLHASVLSSENQIIS